MTNVTHYVIILVYLDRYIVIFSRGLSHGFFTCIKKEVSHFVLTPKSWTKNISERI